MFGSASFHPSKEGFKDPAHPLLHVDEVEFPSLKGRFQSPAKTLRSCEIPPVSIPQRKVSKPPDVRLDRQRVHPFPSLKGRFQSYIKGNRALRTQRCFHPSKEGFKVLPMSPTRCRIFVSIPQRKVSKAARGVLIAFAQGRFPSLKGRFQRRKGPRPQASLGMFPSLKGRFQRIATLRLPESR